MKTIAVSKNDSTLKDALKRGLGIDRYFTEDDFDTEDEQWRAWYVREAYLQAHLNDLKPVLVEVGKFVEPDGQHEHLLQESSLTPTLPILIGVVDRKQFVIDGFHRLAQASARGDTHIEAYVLSAKSTHLARSRFNPTLGDFDLFLKFPTPKKQ